MAIVFLGIGSNVEREKHIRHCLADLRDKFGVIQISRVFESESVGFKGENFYNLVVKISTDYSVAQLVKLLRSIEFENGKITNAERFSARTLDIDLLTYDDLSGVIDGIELPRDEILRNAFVLWPLAEIAPQVIHPVNKQSYQALWQAFDKTQQKLQPIEFHDL